MNTPTKIIVHHTGGIEGDAKASTAHHTAEIIDAWHKLRWPGFTSKVFKNKKGEHWHVGYHVVIEADGTVVQTRAYGEEGAHCKFQNTSSIGICLTGNFDVEYPTKEQTDAFKAVFKGITKLYPNISSKDIYPHRKYSRKSCFGSLLIDDYFSGIVREPMTHEERKEDADIAKQKALLEQIIELLKAKLALLLSLT